MKRGPNKGQILFAKHLKELGLPFQEQVKFKPDRKWLWDFVLTDNMIAIEIDGFYKGRHGAGWGSDYTKQNVGTLLGYRVLRFTTQEVERGEAEIFLTGVDMHNIDEVLADLERLEHKRELAVQRQRQRDRAKPHIRNKEVLWIGLGMLFGAALLGYFILWRVMAP